MKNLDRWLAISALVICILTLAMVTVKTIHDQREAGYVDRVLEETRESSAATREAIEIYRVYVESLRQSMVARGIDAPPLPLVRVKPKQTNKEK